MRKPWQVVAWRVASSLVIWSGSGLLLWWLDSNVPARFADDLGYVPLAILIGFSATAIAHSIVMSWWRRGGCAWLPHTRGHDHTSREVRSSSTLRQLKGVSAIEIKRRSSTEHAVEAHWATVEVRLTGPTKRSLRRLYERVSNLIAQTPLRLSGRSCSLNDLYD